MGTRLYRRSFAGGEVAPEMFGRIDDSAFQNGAATMRNFIVTPQGVARRRPGTRYVNAVKTAGKRTRLIPYRYSTDTQVAIELGEYYIRIHTSGATLSNGTPAAWSGVTAYTAGDLVASGGINYYCILAHTNQVPPNATYWYAQPATGELEIPTAYVESNLFNIHYAQSGDVLTLVHPDHAPRELRRVTSSKWTWTAVTFGAEVASPTSVNAAATVGSASAVALIEYDTSYLSGLSASPTILRCVTGHGLVKHDPIFTRSVLAELSNVAWLVEATDSGGPNPGRLSLKYPTTGLPWSKTLGITFAGGGTPTVNYTAHGLANDIRVQIENTSYSGGAITIAAGTSGALAATPTEYWIVNAATDTFQLSATQGGAAINVTLGGGATGATTWRIKVQVETTGNTTVQYASLAANATNLYVVTAVDTSDTESIASSSASVTNNLAAAGAYNTITWAAVSGAERYRVYKALNGVYGLIGEADGTTFRDDDIAPNMGVTPPIEDESLDSEHPGAVAYFEQRRCFSGVEAQPQDLWMTRTSTDSDLSYRLPTQDTDRIYFRIAARESSSIRHIVPFDQLLLLTSSGEFRVTPVNSDAITPASVSVRPQSYVGASNVQPQVVNNTLVFCAARGGHVREMGYSSTAQGFVTGDLSMRATHLFDGETIDDMTLAKAPYPILWFISSSGDLLGFTYAPEEGVGAWHRHDTDGTFESCAAVSEGDEDVLYLVVKRTINGSTVRYIERMAEQAASEDVDDAFHVDCGLTFDGLNTTATTITVSGGTYWTPTENLTLTASAATFTTGSSDVGDSIYLTASDGTEYVLTIRSVTSTTVATARVNATLPTALRSTATTAWEWSRDSFSGLTHLQGESVAILAGGAVQPAETVASGAVSLDVHARRVQIGLPYRSELKTLPVALAIDGYAQGKTKAISRAHLRVIASGSFEVGPDASNLVPATLDGQETAQTRTTLLASWNDEGQTVVVQDDPLPLSVVGMTVEVTVGD